MKKRKGTGLSLGNANISRSGERKRASKKIEKLRVSYDDGQKTKRRNCFNMEG